MVIKYVGPKRHCRDTTEWHMFALFESHAPSPTITLGAELSEGRFVTFDEFTRMIELGPRQFAPDTIIAASYFRRLAGGEQPRMYRHQ
jgi:hypothetical protein